MKPYYKILRIIGRLNIGGPAINAVLLTAGLEEDFRCVLAAGSPDREEGDFSYFARENNVEPVFLKGLSRQIRCFSDIIAFWKIFRLIKTEKPHIIHTHTAKAGTLGRLAAVLAGVPIKVHTFHGHVFKGYFGPIRTRLFILIERALARRTDRVIAVGDSVRNELCSVYGLAPYSKIIVIQLGLRLDRYFSGEKNTGLLKRELRLSQDYRLVGIVGRLVPIKNHRMFIDAAVLIKRRLPQFKIKFIIAGDGQLKGRLARQAELAGMKEDVVFLGWRKGMDAVYPDLDVVCLSSDNEGTPVSLIEAQACARPVVATDVGGVRDVISHGVTGTLVAPGGTEAFAAAVAELLENEEKRVSFGIKGRTNVMEKFAFARLIKDTRNLYEQLLREKGLMTQ